MKTEINLRTREFVIAREFYWPRLMITLALILLVVLILGGSIFVYLYQMRLEVESKTLAQDKVALQKEAAPLEELELKISDLEKREKLAHSLESELEGWSGDFEKIYRQAGKDELEISSLETTPEGRVIIRGESKRMQRIVRFEQNLARMGAAFCRFISFPVEEEFGYEIELNMSAADGGDQ